MKAVPNISEVNISVEAPLAVTGRGPSALIELFKAVTIVVATGKAVESACVRLVEPE